MVIRDIVIVIGVCLKKHSISVCFNRLNLVQQGYEHTESSVRKASVFCLVAIYAVIGEDLKPHLGQLPSSKVCFFVFVFFPFLS